MKKKTNLYILTGFLGAGKTTLLLGMMKHLEPARVGVIQNEFGKVNIDGEIIKKDGIEISEISRGSIFCSCLKLSFVKALHEMAKKNLDYLIVESSGLGDPSNVEEILEAVREISDNELDFRGVICAVDAVNFKSELSDMETVNRQLKHCNISVITKSDLVSLDELEELNNEIRRINPICKILRSDMGTMDYSFFEEDIMSLKWAEAEETLNAPQNKAKTLVMDIKEEIDLDEMKRFLDIVKKECFRIKGFADVKGLGLCSIDAVLDIVEIKKIEESDKDRKIVFISKTGPAIIRTIINAQKEYISTDMKLKN